MQQSSTKSISSLLLLNSTTTFDHHFVNENCQVVCFPYKNYRNSNVCAIRLFIPNGIKLRGSQVRMERIPENLSVHNFCICLLTRQCGTAEMPSTRCKAFTIFSHFSSRIFARCQSARQLTFSSPMTSY